MVRPSALPHAPGGARCSSYCWSNKLSTTEINMVAAAQRRSEQLRSHEKSTRQCILWFGSVDVGSCFRGPPSKSAALDRIRPACGESPVSFGRRVRKQSPGFPEVPTCFGGPKALRAVQRAAERIECHNQLEEPATETQLGMHFGVGAQPTALFLIRVEARRLSAYALARDHCFSVRWVPSEYNSAGASSRFVQCDDTNFSLLGGIRRGQPHKTKETLLHPSI